MGLAGRLTAAALAFTTTACAALGYTDRVLWRLPSPDGRMVAVCQEIPAFDGPGVELRIERPDGSRIKTVYTNGDGDPCSEIAWSPDGRLIVVLSGHVARLRFIDVTHALADTSGTRYWFWPQIDISWGGVHRNGSGVRFTSAREVELRVCDPRPYTPGDAGRRDCGTSGTVRRVEVPPFRY